MADKARAKTNMTYTELREQILANAVHLFPKVVSDILKKYQIHAINPEGIFSIVTINASANPFKCYQHLPDNMGEGIQAALTYGTLSERKTAITAKPCGTHMEAAVELLRATEKALVVVSDHSVPWTVKRVETASRRGGYDVDATLLMRNGTCPNGPVVLEDNQSGESGYDSEIDIREGLVVDRDFV